LEEGGAVGVGGGAEVKWRGGVRVARGEGGGGGGREGGGVRGGSGVGEGGGGGREGERGGREGAQLIPPPHVGQTLRRIKRGWSKEGGAFLKNMFGNGTGRWGKKFGRGKWDVCVVTILNRKGKEKYEAPISQVGEGC